MVIGVTGSYTTAGTCTGIATDAWYAGAAGKFNSSLGLDGTNDYIVADDVADLVVGSSYSIGGWIKTSQAVTNSPEIFAFNQSDASRTNRHLLYMYTGNILRISDEMTGLNYTGSAIVNDGNWHHIVEVFDDNADIFKLYVDGNVDISYPKTINAIVAADYFSIGQEWDTGPTASNFLQGLIDDFRVYNYPLTKEQVLLDYNQGSAVRFR